MTHSLIDYPGTLWERLEQATAHALASGALEPIETRSERLADGGVEFIVRIVSSLARKAQAARNATAGTSPLWPYEPDLYVTDVSPDHVAILNKYNVLAHHLLLVTRQEADQEEWLTVEDFAALLRCMREFDALGFYNAGKAAGASQARKHLQVVPLPLDDTEGPVVPIEALIRSPGNHAVERLAALDFVHALGWLDATWLEIPEEGAHAAFELYRQLLVTTGLVPPEERPEGHQSGPYNLVVTRRWMLLVPRSLERYKTIGVNALGYAGALLAGDERRLDAIKEYGPMNILRGVSIPRSPT